MTPSTQLEALLLYRGEPISKKEAGKLLGIDAEELTAAVSELAAALRGRGITLIESDESVALATAPEASSLIEQLEREENSGDLSRAALETLALITYEGPLPKSRIDYVRGVNANFILRSLMTRGLIERIADPENARQILYRPTIEFLGHLGISRPSDLPEYEEVRKNLAERVAALRNEEKKTTQIIEDLESDPDHDD